jgi:hypothetical protein
MRWIIALCILSCCAHTEAEARRKQHRCAKKTVGGSELVATKAPWTGCRIRTLVVGPQCLRSPTCSPRLCKRLKGVRVRTLSLGVFPGTQKRALKLASCPHLTFETLQVASVEANDDALLTRLLRTNPKVKALYLERSSTTGGFLQAAKPLESVRILHLEATMFSPSSAIANLPRLEQLSWQRGRYNATLRAWVLQSPPASFWRALGSLRRLRRVSISSLAAHAVDKHGFAALAKLPRLEQLELLGGLSSAGCQHLSQLRKRGNTPFPKLKKLDILPLDLDAACATSLGRLAALRTLRVARAKLGKGALRGIATARQVKVLDLDRSTWPPTESLHALLPQMTHLKTLRVSRGQLDAVALRKARRLQIKVQLGGRSSSLP